jgi:hypothetical protein
VQQRKPCKQSEEKFRASHWKFKRSEVKYMISTEDVKILCTVKPFVLSVFRIGITLSFKGPLYFNNFKSLSNVLLHFPNYAPWNIGLPEKIEKPKNYFLKIKFEFNISDQTLKQCSYKFFV